MGSRYEMGVRKKPESSGGSGRSAEEKKKIGEEINADSAARQGEAAPPRRNARSKSRG